MLKCDQCGIEFLPDKPWQRFHSTQCRSKWHDNRKREARLQIRGMLTNGLRVASEQAVRPLIEQARLKMDHCRLPQEQQQEIARTMGLQTTTEKKLVRRF
jgi:hypothetical protein